VKVPARHGRVLLSCLQVVKGFLQVVKGLLQVVKGFLQVVKHFLQDVKGFLRVVERLVEIEGRSLVIILPARISGGGMNTITHCVLFPGLLGEF
jgi:ribosomal protein L30/L7E